MNKTYVLADLLLTLVSLGLKREDILARLDSARSAGMPEEEVPAMLRKWRDEEIDKAVKAVAALR